MSKQNDWFRSSGWSKEDQELFERKLARARSHFQKAQYLKIKALALEESKDSDIRKEGRKLLQRIITDYQEQKSEVVCAFEYLGESYRKEEKLKEAEEHYRKCIRYYEENLTRTGCRIHSYFLLAELIVGTKQHKKYPEAEALFDIWMNQNKNSILNSLLYHYCIIRARLAMQQNKMDEAIVYAAKALEVAEAGKYPQFSRHKTIGLVKEDPDITKEMKKIIRLSKNNMQPSPDVR